MHVLKLNARFSDFQGGKSASSISSPFFFFFPFIFKKLFKLKYYQFKLYEILSYFSIFLKFII